MIKKKWHRQPMKYASALGLSLSFLGGIASAADNSEKEFNIGAQSISSALIQFATQADVEIIASSVDISNLSTEGISGSLSIDGALAQLLQGTGLEYNQANEGQVFVRKITGTDSGSNSSKKNLNSDRSVADKDRYRIEDIIVTATRRETSLNDAAMSIAAIDSEEISRRNISEMNDYLRTVPGVNYVESGVGRNAVVIRGLTVSPLSEGFQSSPTVGVYFGDVSLTGLSNAGGNPDIKLIDLERVEILRGPQGTLFGSSSLGGTVRNIPAAPDFQKLEGKIKTSYTNTAEEGGGNTKFESVINVPVIEDVLAVRAVAYHYDTSGYIKNIAGTQLATGGERRPGALAAGDVANFGGAGLYQDEEDVGNSTHTGGRLSVLWAPTDDLNISLHYLKQDTEQEGSPFAQLNLGTYTQASQQVGNNVPELRGEELGNTDDINLTNLVMEYDLGWGTIFNSSAWVKDDSRIITDASIFVSGLPIIQDVNFTSEAFIEEIRLVSSLEGPFQYITGLYYEDIDIDLSTATYATADLTLNFFGNPFGSTNPLQNIETGERPVKQLSYYGELSYQLTEQFEITGGLRYYDYDRTVKLLSIGALSGGVVEQSDSTEETGTTFKANLSYTPSEETLLYAQWTQGFRLGNATSPPPLSLCDVNNDGLLDGTATPITTGFDSDSTENFEFGAKLSLLNNRLQINSAIYRINWEDIPLRVAPGALPGQTQTCFVNIVANAGEARSQGFEMEAIFQLNDSVRLNLGGAYTNAELTEDFSAGVGFDGDRLPQSPDYNINLGLLYEFDLANHPTYVQADYAYVSEIYADVGERGGKGGDYGQLNMSMGVDVKQFRIEAFANNLTNDDGITVPPTVTGLILNSAAYRLRPRTIGLNISYEF